jgi:hypothetical protein
VMRSSTGKARFEGTGRRPAGFMVGLDADVGLGLGLSAVWLASHGVGARAGRRGCPALPMRSEDPRG